MKKIALLATLSICNITYSSHTLTYTETNSQRRRLPSALAIKQALEKAGHHKAAQQSDLIKNIEHTTLSYTILENLFDHRDLFPREIDEASATVFKIGVPVEKSKL